MTNPSNSNGPSADLKEAIDSSFGSLDELKTKFNAAAASRFGKKLLTFAVLCLSMPKSFARSCRSCTETVELLDKHSRVSVVHTERTRQALACKLLKCRVH